MAGIKKIIKLKSKKEDTRVVKDDGELCTNRGLRDIMNRDKLFTMIYSGVESKDYFKILYDLGIRDFLMSFHYIQNKNLDMNLEYGGLGIEFFIDSGAHTYQNDPKYMDLTIDYWESHLKKYLAWVKENKEYIFAIANFDFENIVGADIVKRWNEEYFEPFMLETGVPVCFVWHQNSHCSWEKYCERYPYVGFSSVNTEGVAIDLKEYVSKLKIAEHYDSLVHGFGMTRTSMLTKLPFYTSDSTTWLVGLQYGEVNYWTGNRMTRLKKEKWKGEFFDRIVNDFNLDPEAFRNENTEEMIKANINAFVLAELYIRDKLAPRMYWLKPKTVENDYTDKSLFPTLEWLKAEKYDDLEMYCERLNISTDTSRKVSIEAVQDCTVFCNWDNPEFKEFIDLEYIKTGIIPGVHQYYINKIRSSDEERIGDLIEFFQDVVAGKNDALLIQGSAFQKRAQERDEYIDDTEYDYVDIDEDEIKRQLSNILPSPEDGEDPAPDLAELEDEIFSDLEIVPVRDAQGRFLKGQKKIKRPKNLYSDKYPKLACDTCYASQTCPEYKANHVCAFNKMFKRYDTRDMGDIIEAMQGMVGLNLERMQRVAIFEMLDGGLPDGNLTGMIDQNMRLLANLKQMYEYGSPEVLRKTTVMRADGSSEETTQITNPQEGGILERLFSMQTRPHEMEDEEGGRNKPREDIVDEEEDIIEVEEYDIEEVVD